MRKDVKIGLALSVVLVVFAGWYYNRSEPASPTIALDDTQSMAKQLAHRKLPPLPAEPSTETASRPAVEANRRSTSPIQPDRTRREGDRNPQSNGHRVRALRRPARKSYNPDSMLGEGVDLLGQVSDAVADTHSPVKTNQRDADERHRAKKGDTLSRLAEIYYGNKELAHLLVKANPELPIDKPLPVNAIVRIPSHAGSPFDFSNRNLASDRPSRADHKNTSDKQSKPSDARKPEGGRTYEVKKGDSFYAIAAKELGSGARWSELYAMNRDVVGKNPNRLRPGQVLKLPADQ